MIPTLALNCPAGTVQASGSVAMDGLKSPEAHADVHVDLAALCEQIPHTLRLQDGLTLDKGAVHVAVKVGLKDVLKRPPSTPNSPISKRTTPSTPCTSRNRPRLMPRAREPIRG